MGPAKPNVPTGKTATSGDVVVGFYYRYTHKNWNKKFGTFATGQQEIITQ